MQTSTSLRLLAVPGPLLALSCWITAALLFGNLLGESFSDDPVEQAHMAASRRLWTITDLPCRDCCRLYYYLTPENDPNVHESYLQPGDSVRFRVVPSKDEQVGVRLWFHGKDEFLWFVHWTPNTSLVEYSAQARSRR